MLYFSKIQDDSYQIIAPISCIMASFHKPNLTDIISCVALFPGSTPTNYNYIAHGWSLGSLGGCILQVLTQVEGSIRPNCCMAKGV